MLCFGSCGRCGWTLSWFGHGPVQRMLRGAESHLVFPRKEGVGSGLQVGEAAIAMGQYFCVPSWETH